MTRLTFFLVVQVASLEVTDWPFDSHHIEPFQYDSDTYLKTCTQTIANWSSPQKFLKFFIIVLEEVLYTV